ncbi:MAG: DUF2474 domain-containing protein [Erythrobacter sp.]|nr:DUF2474 domain-containing protein [Erythrobacter sp.]
MRTSSRAVAPQENGADEKPLWQRLAWMAAIWLTSVATLGIVGLLLRLWLAP